MSGEEECVVDLFDTTDGAPLFGGQLLTESRQTLCLVALQHQGIGHTVGECVATSHLRLVALFKFELRIVKPEVGRVVLCCR